jgi:hypothetical protein
MPRGHQDSARAGISQCFSDSRQLYEEPSYPPSAPQLKYLNSPVEDGFAIIIADSAANPLFPSPNAPLGELDPSSAFLSHLRKDYFSGDPNQNRLSLVVYTTKGEGLVRETSVLYWIKRQAGRMPLI